MNEHLPSGYHVGMYFEVLGGAYRGQSGSIVEIDFAEEWIGLQTRPDAIIRPRFAHVRLIDHGPNCKCTQPREVSDAR